MPAHEFGLVVFSRGALLKELGVRELGDWRKGEWTDAVFLFLLLSMLLQRRGCVACFYSVVVFMNSLSCLDLFFRPMDVFLGSEFCRIQVGSAQSVKIH